MNTDADTTSLRSVGDDDPQASSSYPLANPTHTEAETTHERTDLSRMSVPFLLCPEPSQPDDDTADNLLTQGSDSHMRPDDPSKVTDSAAPEIGDWSTSNAEAEDDAPGPSGGFVPINAGRSTRRSQAISAISTAQQNFTNAVRKHLTDQVKKRNRRAQDSQSEEKAVREFETSAKTASAALEHLLDSIPAQALDSGDELSEEEESDLKTLLLHNYRYRKEQSRDAQEASWAPFLPAALVGLRQSTILNADAVQDVLLDLQEPSMTRATIRAREKAKSWGLTRDQLQSLRRLAQETGASMNKIGELDDRGSKSGEAESVAGASGSTANGNSRLANKRRVEGPSSAAKRRADED